MFFYGGINIKCGIVLTRLHDTDRHTHKSHKPAVSTEELMVGSVWKIQIIFLQIDNWILAGIIETIPLSANSYSDSTSYGWACGNQVYVGGLDKSNQDGWSDWKANDVAIFKL